MWRLVVGLLAGCSFTPGMLFTGDSGSSDGSTSTDDTIIGAADLVVSHVGQADAAPGTGALTLSGTTTIDTTSLVISGFGSLPSGVAFEAVAQASGPELAVLRVSSFDVTSAANVRVIGDRPFVVIAAGDMTISGTLDGGSRRATPGPGGGKHDQAHTGRGIAGQNDGSVGDSGGSGGGYATSGAAGGGGGGPESNPTVTVTGPMGGAAHGTPELAVLRGGGAGGLGSPCMTDPGGAGGGAIQLSAFGSITISGVIHVGGGGGGRGYRCPSTGGSGGGGGAGGAIFVEANTITISGILAANGAGGGSGADSPNNLDGIFGEDASPVAAAATGAPEVNGGVGGAGGAGGWRDAIPVKGADTGYANGGGGGGAAGRVVVRTHAMATLGGLSTPMLVALTY